MIHRTYIYDHELSLNVFNVLCVINNLKELIVGNQPNVRVMILPLLIECLIVAGCPAGD